MIRVFVLALIFLFVSCKETLENKMNRIEKLGEKGKYAEAIRMLDEIIASNPKYMRAYTYKASYLFMIPSRKGKATEVLNEAININPNCGGCYYTRGLFSHGPQAIADLDKAIEMNKKDFEGYYSRAQEKRLCDDIDGAIMDFNKAMELNPEIIKTRGVFSERAGCWIELAQYDSAIIDISKALRVNPSDADAYFMRSMYYLKSQKDFIKAKQDFIESKAKGLDTMNVRIGEQIFGQ